MSRPRIAQFAGRLGRGVVLTGNTLSMSTSTQRRNLHMADPWMALDVLRELDEANATYFALTLHDHYSRHYLVSSL